MVSIKLRHGEPVDSALKRLKTKLDNEGILDDMRRKRYHEGIKEYKLRKARSAKKRNSVQWTYTCKEEIPADKVFPQK